MYIVSFNTTICADAAECTFYKTLQEYNPNSRESVISEKKNIFQFTTFIGMALEYVYVLTTTYTAYICGMFKFILTVCFMLYKDVPHNKYVFL